MATSQPTPRDDHDLLPTCALFEGLSREQRSRIASLMTQRVLEPGAVLVREGDASADLMIIQQGSVEVTKRVAGGNHDQRIGTLRDGDTLGEMNLVSRARRSATARALLRTRVGVLSMDRLERLAASDPEIERQMLRNLANELSRRLRLTNDTTVAALEEQIALERTRSIMGRFVVVLASLMVTYAFALKFATDFLPESVSVSAVSLPLIFLYAGALYRMMRLSGAPFEAFGLTLRHWRGDVREALLYTIPLCALATLTKIALLRGSAAFADEPLFNLAGLLDSRNSWSAVGGALLLGLIYAAAVPLQEFVVRAGLQRSLQGFLTGSRVTVRAIVVSNALFAAAHLHLSLWFAVITFFPGLVWGALYARQKNLLGVSISHIFCGWFVFLALGFEPWY